MNLTSASVLSRIEMPDVELFSDNLFCICEMSTIELLSYKTVAVTTLLRKQKEKYMFTKQKCQSINLHKSKKKKTV